MILCQNEDISGPSLSLNSLADGMTIWYKRGMDEYVNVRAIAFALNTFSPHSYLVDSPASLERVCCCPHLRVTIPLPPLTIPAS